MRTQVRDVLAVDLAEAMLERLCAAHGCGSPLGNEPGVRPWLGDVESVPAYQVPGRARFCPVRWLGAMILIKKTHKEQVLCYKNKVYRCRQCGPWMMVKVLGIKAPQ